jgi:excisionase family DNA binding protein
MRTERVVSIDGGCAPNPSGAYVPRLLTLPEVAAYLSVSPKTVRRLLRRGLPCVRLGRVVRFRQADLLRFVEARKG